MRTTINVDPDVLLSRPRPDELDALSREIEHVDWERGTTFESRVARSPVARSEDRFEVWIALLGGLLGAGGYLLFS